jgi:hypothetical protein
MSEDGLGVFVAKLATVVTVWACAARVVAAIERMRDHFIVAP